MVCLLNLSSYYVHGKRPAFDYAEHQAEDCEICYFLQ